MLPVRVFVQILSAVGCQRSGLGVGSPISYFRLVHVYKIFIVMQVDRFQPSEPDQHSIKRRTTLSHSLIDLMPLASKNNKGFALARCEEVPPPTNFGDTQRSVFGKVCDPVHALHACLNLQAKL